MALIKVPSVTLHRGALANASRIIKLNMTDQGFDQALIDTIPTLVPHLKAVSNFFMRLETAFFVENLGTGYIPYAIPKFYRSDINKQIRVANFNFAYMDGGLLPDSPPIQISAMPTHAFADANDTYDFSAHFTGGDAYTITTYPDKFSWVDATGVLTYDTDGESGAFNPLITAVNVYGSTQSTETATLSYS